MFSAGGAPGVAWQDRIDLDEIRKSGGHEQKQSLTYYGGHLA